MCVTEKREGKRESMRVWQRREREYVCVTEKREEKRESIRV